MISMIIDNLWYEGIELVLEGEAQLGANLLKLSAKQEAPEQIGGQRLAVLKGELDNKKPSIKKGREWLALSQVLLDRTSDRCGKVKVEIVRFGEHDNLTGMVMANSGVEEKLFLLFRGEERGELRRGEEKRLIKVKRFHYELLSWAGLAEFLIGISPASHLKGRSETEKYEVFDNGLGLKDMRQGT